MEYFLIGLAAAVTSALTLFSGFGLGTLLMPVFAVFFPLDVAIALTAIVHLLNNVFKLFLVGSKAHRGVVIRFGLPAIAAAFAGAWLLTFLENLQPFISYELLGKTLLILPQKIFVALIMIFFAVFELIPSLAGKTFDQKYLLAGGLLSGFFGGLSGHQGALRSGFLIRSDLSKESFIGTGVFVACLVDLSRLSVYGNHFLRHGLGENAMLLSVASFCAFTGAWIGNHFIKKVTLHSIQMIVSILLFLIAIALAAGVI